MSLTPYGLTLTQGQQETLAKAAREGTSVTLRLAADQLQGGDKLGLTKRQINHIEKKAAAGAGAEITFSMTQMKRMRKTGGILPLLSLIPMILAGVGAAGGLAGGAAGIAKAVDDKAAAKRAQAEASRHNREVEAALKGGSGVYLGRETHGGCCPACKGSGLYLSKN